MYIKTELLRYLLYFYGNLSLQLRPIHWTNYRSLINFTWNFALQIDTFVVMRGWLPLAGTQAIRENYLQSFARKPLFFLIFQFTGGYAFPLLFFFNLVYFMLLNLVTDQLIPLLDSFHAFANRKKTNQNQNGGESDDSRRRRQSAARIMLAIVTFDQTLYIATLPLIFKKIFFEINFRQTSVWFLLRISLNYIAYYTLNDSLLIILGIVCFYKHSTLQSLNVICERLRLSKSKNFAQTLDSIRRVSIDLIRLSNVNRRLDLLLSAPIVSIVYIVVFHVIILLISYSVRPFDLEVTLNLAGFMLFLLCVVRITQRIDAKLDCIRRQIDELWMVNCRRDTGRSIDESDENRRNNRRYQSAIIIAFESIDLHRRNFAWNIGNDFMRIDALFCFNSLLFILNYTVIFLQTNS